MKTSIGIRLLAVWVLLGAMVNILAQDGGFLPDLPGFPSGTYAQVAAVGAKLHGNLTATEKDPVTGETKRYIRMTYYGPTDTYARMGICSVYTPSAMVARHSNPSAVEGRDIVRERRSVKYYRRDGSGGGYTLLCYAAGAVDRVFEYETQSDDIGMPSPGAVGRPFENLSATDSLEVNFAPKATVFTLKNQESNRPDDTMAEMLLRLEGAAGAAANEVQGIVELGSLVLEPMKAVGLAKNMGQAIVHWDQTMAAIQRQVDDAANTYWESRLGLINPEDAYRKEGAFLFHLASNVTGGWVVKGGRIAQIRKVVPTNPVPSRLARVLPSGMPVNSLGRVGLQDVFVTAAEDIAGMNASQIAERLGIAKATGGFDVFEFPTPPEGIASPVFRSNPGFIGGGKTSGGAREYVIPNGPIPPGASRRSVP